jgi:hypothetical protein
MPLLAKATTIALLQDAFQAAIEGLTPRVTRGKDTNRWKYYARPHNPLMGTRWFRFEWERLPDPGDGIQNNAVYEVIVSCVIVTDYGGVPHQDADAMVLDDFEQLVIVLDALRPTTDGLRRVLPISPNFTDESQDDQAQVAHSFTVRYLQTKVV